jgi:SAM-dependent methyltransferase
VPDFAPFDARRYRTLDVRRGYAEWAPTYDRTVHDPMDIGLLEEINLPLSRARTDGRPSGRERARPEPGRRRSGGKGLTAADLGCGTGRTGVWLHQRGIAHIDGVDLTPEMLDAARQRGVYRRLVEADIAASGLEASAYNLVVSCLVDEHLADLQPLYREAARLVKPGGIFVLVGYHPHFIMAFGVPTHFDSPSGEPVAIETHVHLLSDHVTAGLDAGWTLAEMRERVIEGALLAAKPNWERYRGHPVSFAFVWRQD